jgi:biopolymer transport protein ExbB
MLDILIKGGWVMLPLLICSAVALTVVIERLYFFRKTAVSEQAEQILRLTARGDLNEARQLSSSGSTPFLRVFAAGLASPGAPAKAMEAAAITEVAAMKRGLPVLDTIITLSPLLGLLGTIIGMIGSFQIMAGAGGLGQPHAVTGGVAEALIATATGITVAVTSLIPYNYFLARVEKETEALEHYSTRLEVALAAQAHGSDNYENIKKYA